MAIKSYLQLVRLPNLFTAAADPLAGWLVATGSLAAPGRWVPLVAASVLIYAGGIVLNDVFDIEIDRGERPNRPLPAGRVSFRLAAWSGGLMLGCGPIVAALSGSWTSALVAGLLALCVLAYDGGLKRTWVGPVAMGACRSLNLLLGLSQLPDLGGRYAWIVAGCYGLFVVGVTIISRSEVETGRQNGIVAGMNLQWVALAIFWVSSGNLAFQLHGSRAYDLAHAWGSLVWVVVLGAVLRADVAAVRDPTPERTQRAVKTGVLALVWIDVALVAMVTGIVPGLVVAALWVPAFLLARWLYAT